MYNLTRNIKRGGANFGQGERGYKSQNAAEQTKVLIRKTMNKSVPAKKQGKSGRVGAVIEGRGGGRVLTT